MRTTLRLAVCVLAAVGLSAAEPAYIGKWKLNIPRSDFGQLTVTYELTPDGSIKTTMDGQSYTAKADEKEVQTPWGTTAAWKKINDKSWEVTQRANGKVISTDKLTLSDDDKTLRVDSKMKKASGEDATNNMVFTRASGGPGLAGSWKTSKMSTTSPTVIEISAKGEDGLVLKFVDQDATCDAKFDGKDHPATGSMWPSGWTCALMKKTDKGFDVMWKKDGKPMYMSNFTAEGNVLTETGGAVATKEKIKAIYDKQ